MLQANEFLIPVLNQKIFQNQKEKGQKEIDELFCSLKTNDGKK